MKIIQVMPEFGLAGAETMCESLAYELQKLGHTVVVVSMYDYHSVITERLEAAGVRVVYLNKKPGLDLSMILKLYNLFRSERPDAIHTHRYVMQYAIPAALLAGVKRMVHTVHNVASKENDAMARKLNKVFYKAAGVIPVALSEIIQDTIVDEYQLEKKQIPIVYNGIMLSKCDVKTDYTVEGCFKILHIGRFMSQKNHLGLLEAFCQARKHCPDMILQMIGDGDLRAQAEQFVEQNGLQDCVEFLGLQSNVYQFLHDADLFTLPSHYEGIPMTLIEAMGTGLPIVATAVGGVPDMLQNGESAWLVPCERDAIAAAIEEAYSNKEKRKAFGKNALLRAEEFSAKKMAAKYVEIYTQ